MIYGQGIGFKIELDSILNEESFKGQKYNEFPGLSKPTFWVFPKEGYNIPHFHIKANSDNFNCAICLYENKFFIHPHAPNVLTNSKQKKFLCEILDSTPKRYNNNLWTALCNIWDKYRESNTLESYKSLLISNKIVSQNKINDPKTIIRPDYSIISESIHQ